MSNFLTASIGRKFIMSISGLFLIMFICVHLGVNLLLVIDDSGELFNQGAHFMATNPLIKVMEPLLGLGFVVHIIWSFLISLQNYKARPVKYDKSSAAYSSAWASRNMLVLGSLVLVFLVIHIIQFFIPVKMGGLESVTLNGVEMHDTYTLVAGLFKESVVYCILYMVAGALLGFHLGHGFWSAFQTVGLNNKYWLARLQFIGKIYAIVVAVGFAIIPLYFLIKF
ncbi:MAG: succinate dehydrogenase cytochrome b subunit [Mangrovibacterium sp.]